jgi:hypothetical protein
MKNKKFATEKVTVEVEYTIEELMEMLRIPTDPGKVKTFSLTAYLSHKKEFFSIGCHSSEVRGKSILLSYTYSKRIEVNGEKSSKELLLEEAGQKDKIDIKKLYMPLPPTEQV